MGPMTSTRTAPKPASAGRFEYFRRNVATGLEERLDVVDDGGEASLDLTEVHDALAASQAEAARLRTQVGILEARLGTGQGQTSGADTRADRMDHASRDLEAYYRRQGILPDGTGQTSGADRQAVEDCSRFFKRQVASTRLPSGAGTVEARMDQASRDLEAYYARQGVKPI